MKHGGSALMQWDHSALTKLRATNDETVWGHIVETERQGFRDAQAGRDKQAEESSIGVWPA